MRGGENGSGAERLPILLIEVAALINGGREPGHDERALVHQEYYRKTLTAQARLSIQALLLSMSRGPGRIRRYECDGDVVVRQQPATCASRLAS